MGWESWGFAAAAAFAVILDGILFSDAVYQIVKGRPSFLPIERVLFKRQPATPGDCLLQGASKLLAYTAILIIQLMLVTFTVIARSTGGPQPGGSLGEVATGVMLIASLAIAILLMVGCAIVESRVRFTYLGLTSRSPDHTA